MKADDITGWYVLQTRQHFEKRVVDGLAELKVLAYAPMERHLARHARQTKQVTRPLLPGYVFVHLDGASDYHTVRYMDGVVDFMRRQNRKPAEIEAVEVMLLNLYEQMGEFDMTPMLRVFEAGQSVKATKGQWQDYSLTFDELRADNQAMVRMVMFGGKPSKPFSVDVRHLEAA